MNSIQSLLDDQQFVDYFSSLGLLDQVKYLINENTQSSIKQLQDIIIKTDPSQEFLDSCSANPTVIIGNGDIDNYDHGLQLAQEHGVDGIMIGRGIFRDPWAFLSRDQALILDTKENRIQLLLDHLLEWQRVWGDTKHFPVMKKFVKMYISNFPEAVILRTKLMETKTIEEIVGILERL
jgi:tRNA-dihydrouridine synthase